MVNRAMHLFYRVRQLIIVSGDAVSYIAGFWLSLLVRNLHIPTGIELERHVSAFATLFMLWLVLNYINGLYDLERNTPGRTFYRRFGETALLSLALGIAYFYLLDPIIAPKTILLLNVLFGYSISLLCRIAYQRLCKPQTLALNVVLVGWTAESGFLIDLTRRRPEKGYRIVAVIDPNGAAADIPADITRMSTLSALAEIIKKERAAIVVIAPYLHKDAEALRELYGLLFTRVEITDVPGFYEIVTGRIPPSTFSEGWFLEHLRRTEKPIYDRMRALFDYVFGAVMMTVLALLFIPTAAAIKLTSRGPIFYRQRRVGYRGKEFTLYKFRSMYALTADGSAELNGVEFAQKNDKRITPFGRFLRRSRMDELPQAWNLLKREVTLIGPRPERPEIVAEMEKRMPYYPLRHLVRPGLTGWALINQNYTDNYDKTLQKLQYDLYYIKNRSALLDTAISLRTINVLIRLMGQ